MSRIVTHQQIAPNRKNDISPADAARLVAAQGEAAAGGHCRSSLGAKGGAGAGRGGRSAPGKRAA
jgi:hypothetical protein